tara:strand:+ start:429 stop:653 length:225 start_codon:yes stop_codon:yes gene_type:complete
MREVKDISPSMKYGDYILGICDHYCNKKAKKCNFYDWFTYLDHKFIKRMCEACALRETWGYNYKQRKGYKLWNA